MKTASFKTTKEESKLITKIATRAVSIATKYGVEYAMREAYMDITACHANGMPLRLTTLLKTDDFTFAHDVFGIRQHINRTTGEIADCFVPRTASSQEVAQ